MSKTILASETGARLDSDVRAGGGADDTEALQAALDRARTLGSVRLVMDGAARVAGLDLHSNTTVECLDASCGFFLADGSDRPILRNADPSDEAIRNRNIALRGGTYNGNAAGQVHHTPDNNWVTALGFFGVENLSVRDIALRNGRTFALHLANWHRVTLENITIDQDSLMLCQNQDGIHVNGPGRFLTARNLQGFGEDDFFALNADDGEGALSETRELGPWVREGDITDVYVDGLFLDDSVQGVRLLSRVSRLDRVTIRNVVGTNRDFGFLIEPFGDGRGGNFGSILIDNVDLRQRDPLKRQYGWFMMTVSGRVESLTVRNVRRHGSADHRPLIHFPANADVRQFTLDGLTVYESAPSSRDTDQIVVEGNVEALTVRNAQLFREEGLPPSGALVRLAGETETAGVRDLHLNGIAAHRLACLVAHASGRRPRVRADYLHLHDGGAVFDPADLGADS